MGRLCVGVERAWNMWEVSVLSAQFFYELKTALKKRYIWIVSWYFSFLSIKRNKQTNKTTHQKTTQCVMVSRRKIVQISNEWVHTKKRPKFYVRKLTNVCIFAYF